MTFTNHCSMRNFPVHNGVGNLSEDIFTFTIFVMFQQPFYISISVKKKKGKYTNKVINSLSAEFLRISEYSEDSTECRDR